MNIKLVFAALLSITSFGVLGDESAMASGFIALESACFACHSPDALMENRIAPPMAAIKKHYIDESTTYEEFRVQLVSFVTDPSAANAQLPGAIGKYGVMPKLSFDADEINQIAYYIYRNPLEAPDWFERHYKEEQQKYRQMGRQKLTTEADYLRRGKEFAMSTKSVLGGNLKQAINTGGTVSAISFCNGNAAPIAKSQSAKLGASITRVTDKPRNPDNIANDIEMEYIHAAKASLLAGDQPKPIMQEIDGRMVGYYPVITNGMCLQCHGTPGKELLDKTIVVLDTLYPNDQARGYGENELRGIFVVSMEKE